MKSLPSGKRKLSTWALALIGVGTFALTIALIYLQENVRGELAWGAYKKQYEAKGKSLDWVNHIPPTVEDDQNIYKAPGMSGMVKTERGSVRDSISVGISEMSQIISNTRVTNHVVAQVYVLANDRSAPADARAVASADEVAAALNARGRMLEGASGIRLCNGDLIRGEPLKFALTAGEDAFEELRAQIRPYDIRSSKENRFEIYIESVHTAEEYLKAYELRKTYFEQLANALRRPYARMDGDYANPAFVPIQNFVALRTIAQTLGQVAQSCLLLNRPQEALQALTLIHESERLLTAAPSSRAMTLVASMIHVAIKGLYVSVVADGHALGVWRAEQMVLLQNQFEQVDLVPLVRKSLEFELIAVSNASQMMPLEDLFSVDPRNTKRYLYRSAPKGWLLQNVVRYCELMEEQAAAFSAGAPGVRPAVIGAQSERLLQQLDRSSPYIYLARMAIPNFNKAIQTATKNQTMVQLANISLALERHRLATGEYPETLESLSPAYLTSVPRDLITGVPPIYRSRENGKYLLYSLGWNEKDDGGLEGKNSGEGDWVWNPKRK